MSLLCDATQPRALTVEKDEILARAAELEEPIPGVPTENPQAPCAHAVAMRAAQQLALSANNLRSYLRVGERERGRLAESLRDAAKAYEEVDEDAGEAINNGTSMSAVTPRLADGDLDAAMPSDTPVAAAGVPELPEYADLTQTAWEIENGDQGIAFERFAQEWIAHQQQLRDAAFGRFRPFQHWDGEAAYAVEALFDRHRSWLFQMADLCGNLATQARDVVTAHRRANNQHVLHSNGNTFKHKDLVWLHKAYQTWYSDPIIRSHYMDLFAKLQRKSDEVVAEYRRAATLELVNPPMPPVRSGPTPGNPGFDFPTIPGGGSGLPGDELPVGNPLPNLGMPSAPTAGTPAMPDTSKLTNALAKAPGRPTGSGVKPASFGGGGAAGMPLQPPVEGGGGAAGGVGGLGRSIPGVGGAMGKGGMGMGPMGAPGAGHGKDQGAGKGKRGQGEESLYTEERSWTEGIIGLFGVKQGRDNDRSKQVGG
jgi:hypothetical protein